jgi:hypothetical protein
VKNDERSAEVNFDRRRVNSAHSGYIWKCQSRGKCRKCNM